MKAQILRGSSYTSAIPAAGNIDRDEIMRRLYDPATHFATFNALVATQTAKGLNDEILARVRELVDWLHSQEVGGVIATDGGPDREERIVFEYDRHPLPNVLHFYLREWGSSYLVGERDVRYPEGTRPDPAATSWLLTEAIAANAAQVIEIQRLKQELFTAENRRVGLMTILGVQGGSFDDAVAAIEAKDDAVEAVQRLTQERDEARALNRRVTSSYCGVTESIEEGVDHETLKRRIAEHIVGCDKHPLKAMSLSLEAALKDLGALEAALNTPEIHDFAKGVVLEAQHQRARWGSDHDAGKQPEDWFWLLGYLGGKCLAAQRAGDRQKALHHTISTAAALANWHAAMLGQTNMRPGIDPGERAIDEVKA